MGSPIDSELPIEEEALVETFSLTLRDRCDATANGVEAAQVAVWFKEGQEPLLLCHHHYSQHEAAISNRNPFKIHDQRESEVENRAQGAHIG